MKYANGSGVQWERKVQNNSKGLALNNSKEIVSVYGDGESYGREVSSGPGKLPMPLKSQEELSKAAGLQSQKFKGEAQAGMGQESGRVEMLRRSCACLCFPGSETLIGFCDPESGRPPAWRAVFGERLAFERKTQESFWPDTCLPLSISEHKETTPCAAD